MIILAIDPGPKASAYCYVESKGYKPKHIGKVLNSELRDIVRNGVYEQLVIEECIARKWAGREISDTAFAAGRLAECSNVKPDISWKLHRDFEDHFTLISRSKVRGHLTREKKGGDAIMIQELICLFEPKIFYQWRSGQITRPKMIIAAKKGFFKGFKGDIWQAFALAVTFINIKGV